MLSTKFQFIRERGFRGEYFFKSANQKEKFGRKHLWKILYKHCLFHPDSLASMAASGNSCFRLVDFQKSSSLKLLSQMNRNLVGSTYGRFCIKFPQRIRIMYPMERHVYLLFHYKHFIEN
jgi:hypothetical protein